MQNCKTEAHKRMVIIINFGTPDATRHQTRNSNTLKANYFYEEASCKPIYYSANFTGQINVCHFLHHLIDVVTEGSNYSKRYIAGMIGEGIIHQVSIAKKLRNQVTIQSQKLRQFSFHTFFSFSSRDLFRTLSLALLL